MRCELLGTDTKGTPKGRLSLDKAGHRTIVFCKHLIEWKRKKKDILCTEKCSEDVDVCQQNLQESSCHSLLYMSEFYLVPFINLHHVLLWALYSPVLYEIDLSKSISLFSIFENHFFNYNALGELHIFNNQDIFHSSSFLSDTVPQLVIFLS